MESKKINQLATELTPALSDLTIIGDPTTGISKKITLSQMASLFTGTVEEYANLAAFPLVGTADTIYIALDTNVLYRWDTGLTSYVELSPNIINSLVFSDANGFDGTISLVGSVATLTITTALTTGSVPFIGASGALTQDNTNFFWDNSNKRLGINTNTPTGALDVFGSGIIGRVNGTSTNNAFLGFASAGSNKWSIGNVQSDHRFRIYNEATTSELVSVLSTGEFGIGIANPTTKLHIDGGASALIANLDANVSVAKSVSFRSDNSARINLEVSGTESGSNAGANFKINTYSDAGALLHNPITILRSNGYIGISQGTPLSQLHITPTTADVFTNGLRVSRDGVPSQYAILNMTGGAYNYLAVNTTTGEPGYAWLTSTNGTSSTTRMTLNSGTYMLDVTGSGRFTGALVGTSATFSGDISINSTNSKTGGTAWNLNIRDTSTMAANVGGGISFQGLYTTGGGVGNFGAIAAYKTNATSGNESGGLRFYYSANGVITQGLQISETGATTFSSAATFNGNQIFLNGNNPGLIATTATTNLYSYLQLSAGTAESSIYTLGNTYASTGAYIAGGLTIGNETSGGISITANNASGLIRLYTGGGNERMRLTPQGYIKAAPNASYVNPTGGFHELHSTGQSSDLLYARHTQSDPYGIEVVFSGATPNNTSNWWLYCADTTNPKAIIYSNGTFGSRTGTYGSIISDEKYKQDILDASSQWDDIKNIRVVNFKFKQDVELEGEKALRQIGFIAQEVEKVSPNLVYESTDRDSGETWKSVKTSIIEIKAIKALQEAMAKIEILEEKVKQLELK